VEHAHGVDTKMNFYQSSIQSSVDIQQCNGVLIFENRKRNCAMGVLDVSKVIFILCWLRGVVWW
jgi:hypothetical protein